MAKLKCYSCPECGSFLEVDRASDTFDCPFCGSHFDAMDFHGEDLLEQARSLLRRNDFSMAREKYSFLLSKNPNEFEYLYGYACALGEYSSLSKFSEVKRFSQKLTDLFSNDARYNQGPAAPYFAKLGGMFEISRKYNELLSEQKKLFESAKVEMESVRKAQEFRLVWFGGFLALYCIVGCIYLYPAFVYLRYWGLLIAALYFSVPLIVYLSLKLAHKNRMKKRESEFAERTRNANALRDRATDINKELADLKAQHDKAFEELNALKEQAGLRVPEEPEMNNTSKFEVTAIPSRSVFGKTAEGAAPKAQKAGLCKKCGADLRLDKVRKLYVCDHCGITYDFEIFIGDLRSKANKCLAKGEFGPADKWYEKILEGDPADLEALRGRIFCAAKWKSSSQIELVEDMDPVMRKDITARVNEAIASSVGNELEYFMQFQSLFNIIFNYIDACYALKGNVLAKDRPKWEKKKKALTRSFNDCYQPFVKMDMTVIRKVRARKIEDGKT